MAGGYPLPRERNLILASLLVLAVLAWLVLVRQAGRGMDGEAASVLTMGMAAPLFLAVWVVMMVAMMFPTAAPMILLFARVSASRRARGGPFVPTWVFVTGYLLVWLAFGALAYVLAAAAESAAVGSAALSANAGRTGGAVIVLAGLHQLSPLKRVCLKHCRSPLDFVLSHWRDGYTGALRMGLAHGVYCLGCCWLLFVILFPLGMTNVGAMALVTLLVFAEKVLPFGPQARLLAALVMVLYGGLAVVQPAFLPTTMPGGMEGM
jgi:predicted metal-binding membrane protein